MAEEEIGRADYVLGVDNSGVTKGLAENEASIKASGKQLETEYTSSAYRAGVVIGNGIKAATRVVAAGATALFAVAAKGAIELNSLQADYTAETGATADEAARAGKAINDMAGKNIQPIGEIGKTLAKVHTDLGLVGEEAENETQIFLRFARATKQDAAGAVVAFDDILDAWGLTAKDANVIMDKLIVSHQKYGGSIQANQMALAQLAPQLRALNLTLDDGIALLNLAASAGLDAAAMQTALNTAISKLPPGESLQDFIKRLSQVADDGQRAQMAMDVFGQKAGAKLANAIKPGIGSIDDFKVSTEEATGATNKAANALDDTFGARTQLLINKFGSILRGLGSDWGPLLTGVASAGTLLTSVFGPGLITKLGPKLVALFKSLGAKAGESLADGLTNVWQGAGGTVAGNFIASRIETMVDSTKNSRIAGAIRTGAAKSGALFGAVFAGAQGFAGTLVGGLVSAIAASPLGGPIRAALLAAGIQMGTLQGTAAGAAFAGAATLALIAAPILVIRATIEWVQGHFPDLPLPNFNDLFKNPNDLLAARAAAAQAARDANQAYIDAAIADAERQAPKLGMAVAEAASAAIVEAAHSTDAGDRAADAMVRSLARGINDRAAALGKTLAGTIAQFTHDVPREWADGIKDERATIDDGWDTFLEEFKTVETPIKRVSRLLGRLSSKQLAAGLNDSRPEVRLRAQQVFKDTIDEIGEIVAAGGKIGKTGMERLRLAMHSKEPDIRNAAKAIYRAIHNPIAPAVANARKWGSAIGHGIAAGLTDSWGSILSIVHKIAGAIADFFQTHSPAKLGPLSQGGGPEGMGRSISRLLAKGFAAGAGDMADAASLVARASSLSSVNGPMLRQAGAIGGRAAAAGDAASYRAGDLHIGAIHLHGIGSDVSQSAASRFGQRVLDEIATGFRQQGARSGLHPSVVP